LQRSTHRYPRQLELCKICEKHFAYVFCSLI
jgi:hypothetical protein